MITWEGAAAYCSWLASETNLAWRLPFEIEWEKAARGVDSRLYPWGSFINPSWACVREAQATRLLPATVSERPVDASPYGVRGLAGNARDWCADAWRAGESPVRDGERFQPAAGDSEMRTIRGGSWNSYVAMSRAAFRYGVGAQERYAYVSFRPARSLDQS